MVADGFGDLLGVNKAPAGFTDGQFVQPRACFPIMFLGFIQMTAIVIVLEQWQQPFDRLADIADDAQIHRYAAANLFCSDIDLRDAHARSTGIKLPVREIGPQHQKYIAIEHGVVALTPQPISPSHADIVRIVPVDVLPCTAGAACQ